MLQSDNQFGGSMISREKVRFFNGVEDQGIALTYDDVRLHTEPSPDTPPPDHLDITSHFSRNVELKVPIVSAAMDTVTGSKMAIAMAKLGGIGVIHAAQSIESQYSEVRKVKKEVSGLIEKPITVFESDTLAEVLHRCAKDDFDFRSFPVLNHEGKFAGLLTSKDFLFPESHEISVGEAMRPADMVATAPEGTTLNEAYHLMQERKVTKLPVLAANGTVAGLYLFSNVSPIYRDADAYNRDSQNRLRVAAAISTGPTGIERADRLRKYVDALVIDTANGDSYYAFETLRELKVSFPKIDVVVGNISNGKSARLLAKAGADGIKVGQGPGSICSTRREIGIGTPQVTAVHRSYRQLLRYNALGQNYADVPICADGGITEHGDIPIAFGAGAHSVMMGRLLAGADEAPGAVRVLPDGSKMKMYRGMGSLSALQDNEASRQRYGMRNGGLMLAEGVEGEVRSVGSVHDVIGLCIAAIYQNMAYTKATSLGDLRDKVMFDRITQAGLRESHPHDISIVRP
jgi:IMP dehydrogenase